MLQLVQILMYPCFYPAQKINKSQFIIQVSRGYRTDIIDLN